MSGPTSGFKSLFSRWWCLQPTNIKEELHTSSSLSPHTHICLFLDNLSSCLSCFCQALEESIPWLSFWSLSPFCLLTLPGGRSHPVREFHIWLQSRSDQIRSVAQSCPTLCDPMNRSMPGLPVHHQLLEFTQTHVHRVCDAIQPSHPLLSPFPPAPNPSQHQSLFQ